VVQVGGYIIELDNYTISAGREIFIVQRLVDVAYELGL
jgi:hypothetical protein